MYHYMTAAPLTPRCQEPHAQTRPAPSAEDPFLQIYRVPVPKYAVPCPPRLY